MSSYMKTFLVAVAICLVGVVFYFYFNLEKTPAEILDYLIAVVLTLQMHSAIRGSNE